MPSRNQLGTVALGVVIDDTVDEAKAHGEYTLEVQKPIDVGKPGIGVIKEVRNPDILVQFEKKSLEEGDILLARTSKSLKNKFLI